MKPTVKQIALDLGLSPATVSKALSGRHEISEGTRARVQERAQELGYLKSPGLRRRLGVIAVNPDDMEDSQTSLMFTLLMGFQKYADRVDLDVVVFHINGEGQETLDQFAQKNKFDGLFIMGIKNTGPYYFQLETTTTPIVTLDIHVKNPMVGIVGTNSISGGALAIKHLTRLGHTRIGFVNGHKEAYISQERLAGYLAAMYSHGIPFDQSLCFDGDFSMESGARAAEYFSKTDSTAIYFASDLMAMGAIRHFITMGYDLPGDMSIVGYDNLPLCQGCTPTLTSVAQDPAALGETACALLRSLAQNTPVSRAYLEPWLEIRGSTAALPRP